MKKKIYIHPSMAICKPLYDMSLLETLPVSSTHTGNQYSKERSEENDFEQDVEIGIILGEFEEKEYGSLW